MNTSTETAAIFSRKSKIIWKPSLQLNIGLADLNNYTMEHSSQNSYDFERIELQQYILHGFVLLLVLFGLLFLYICFWKWVAQVNIETFIWSTFLQLHIFRETWICPNLAAGLSSFSTIFQTDLVSSFTSDLNSIFLISDSIESAIDDIFIANSKQNETATIIYYI